MMMRRQLASSVLWSFPSYYTCRISIWLVMMFQLSTIVIEAVTTTAENNEGVQTVPPSISAILSSSSPSVLNDDNPHSTKNHSTTTRATPTITVQEQPEYRLYLRRIGQHYLDPQRGHDHPRRHLKVDTISMEVSIAMGVVALLLACTLIYFQFMKQDDNDHHPQQQVGHPSLSNHNNAYSILSSEQQQEQQHQQRLQKQRQQRKERSQQKIQPNQQAQRQKKRPRPRPQQPGPPLQQQQHQQQQQQQQEFQVIPPSSSLFGMTRQFSSDRLLGPDKYSIHDIPEGTNSGRSSTIFSKTSKSAFGHGGGSSRRSKTSMGGGGGNLSNSRHSSSRKSGGGSHHDTTIPNSDIATTTSSNRSQQQRTIMMTAATVAGGSVRGSQTSKDANSSSRRSSSRRRFLGGGGDDKNAMTKEEPIMMIESSSSSSSNSSPSSMEEEEDLYHEDPYEESFYSKTESSPPSGTTESYQYPPDTPSDRVGGDARGKAIIAGDVESVGVWSQPTNRLDDVSVEPSSVPPPPPPQVQPNAQESSSSPPPSSIPPLPLQEESLTYEHDIVDHSIIASPTGPRPPSPPPIHRERPNSDNTSAAAKPKSSDRTATKGTDGGGKDAAAALTAIGLTALAVTPLLHNDNDENKNQNNKNVDDKVPKSKNKNANGNPDNQVHKKPRKEENNKPIILKHHNDNDDLVNRTKPEIKNDLQLDDQQLKLNNKNRTKLEQKPDRVRTSSLGDENDMVFSTRVPFEVFTDTKQQPPQQQQQQHGPPPPPTPQQQQQQQRPQQLRRPSHISLSSIPEFKALSSSDGSFGGDSFLDHNDEITATSYGDESVDDLDRTLIRGKTNSNKELLPPPPSVAAAAAAPTTNLAQKRSHNLNEDNKNNTNDNVVDDSLRKSNTDTGMINILGPTAILAQKHATLDNNNDTKSGDNINNKNIEDDTEGTPRKEKTVTNQEILGPRPITIIQNNAGDIDRSSNESNDGDHNDSDRAVTKGKTDTNSQPSGSSSAIIQHNPDESNSRVDNGGYLDPLSRKLDAIDQRHQAGLPASVQSTCQDSSTSTYSEGNGSIDDLDRTLIKGKTDSNRLLSGQPSLKHVESDESESESENDDEDPTLEGREKNSYRQELLGEPVQLPLKEREKDIIKEISVEPETRTNTPLFVPPNTTVGMDKSTEPPRKDRPSNSIQLFVPPKSKTSPKHFIENPPSDRVSAKLSEPANTLPRAKNVEDMSHSTKPRGKNNSFSMAILAAPLALAAAPIVSRQNKNGEDDTKKTELAEPRQERTNPVSTSEVYAVRQTTSASRCAEQKNNDVVTQSGTSGKFSPVPALVAPLPMTPMVVPSSRQESKDREECTAFDTIQQESSRHSMAIGDGHFISPIMPHSESKKPTPRSLSGPQLVVPSGTSSDVGSVASGEEKKEEQEKEKKKTWVPKMLNPWNKKEPPQSREVQRLSHQGEERYSMKSNIMDSRSLAGSLRSTTDSSAHSISLDRIPEEDTLVANNLEAFREQVLQAAKWSNSSSISSSEGVSSSPSRSDREWHEEIQDLSYKFDPADDVIPYESTTQSLSSDATSLQFPDSPDGPSHKSALHFNGGSNHSESDSEPILPPRLTINSKQPRLKSSDCRSENQGSASNIFAPSVTIKVMKNRKDAQEDKYSRPTHAEKKPSLADTSTIKNLKEQKRILESNFRKISGRPVLLQKQGSFRTKDTADTSHTSLPGSELGVVCLTSAQEAKEDKDDVMSFSSCTASERRALRDAEEELLEEAQKSSLVIDKKGATLLDEADGEEEWENEAHDMMLKIRNRVGQEYQDSELNTSYSMDSAGSDSNDEFPQKQTSAKSFVDDMDDLLEDMNQDGWEVKAKENMNELKHQIDQLTEQENTGTRSDFDRRVLKFLKEMP